MINVIVSFFSLFFVSYFDFIENDDGLASAGRLMSVALAEYSVGGAPAGSLLRAGRVGGVAAAPPATSVKSITRPQTSGSLSSQDDGRNASFEDTVQLLNVADTLLSPMLTTRRIPSAICKKKKKKKDQRIRSAGAVESKVNLLNSISTLVNFKDEFPLLILAAFSAGGGRADLNDTRNFHKSLNNDFR